jgi:hypothetical protein
MRSERELEGISRDEFRDALVKGLGRALLYVKTYGLDRVKDLVLYACLHDLSYDVQIEGSRAKWLFAMFVDSPDYLEFREAILATMVVEDETWVLLQLCGLAKEMALIGDSIAEQALFDFVYRRANLCAQQHGDDSIIEDWIGVDIETIDLFINNYHSGDAELILAVLNEVEIDNEDLFPIGYSILRLSEKQSNSELGLLLNWRSYALLLLSSASSYQTERGWANNRYIVS